MKAKYLVMAFAAICLAAACSKDEKPSGGNDNPPDVPSTEEVDMTFSISAGALTRCSLTRDESLIWVRNDRVALFDGEACREFKVRTSAAETEMKGQAVASGSFAAVYPFEAVSAFTGDGAAVSIPVAQKAVQVDQTGFQGLAAAATKTDHFDFVNLTAVLKFTMAEDAAGVTGLEIRAIGDEAIAGGGTVAFDGSGPAFKATDPKSVIYVEPSEGSFKAGESYYVYCLPARLSQGLLLTAYRGASAAETLVEGPLELKAGALCDAGTVTVTLTDGEKSLLGRWELVRYGSRDKDDPEGLHAWYTDANDKPLWSSEDNIITFNADGSVELDLGADGHAYNVDTESDFVPELDNPRWTLFSDEEGQYLEFGGGAFPLIVANEDGVNARYVVRSLTSGELILEILRTNEEGESWFIVCLQPVGVSTFYHRFDNGDFGIEGEEDYGLSIDAFHGESVFDGFRWTMSVDADDIFYAWYANSGLRIGIGAWREEIFTPNHVVMETEDIPGEIKAVRVKCCHNNANESEVDINLIVTVDGKPFGARLKVPYESRTFTFTSSQSASGRISIDWEKVSGLYALLIQSIEVVYQVAE